MLFHRLMLPVCLLSLIAVVGCGRADHSPQVYTLPANPSPETFDESPAPADLQEGNFNLVAYQPNAAPAEPVAQPRRPAAAPPVDRKIIYNATLDIVVDDFDGVPRRIRELAAEHGAFIAKSNLKADAGRSRHGTWTIRVPVEQYDAFVGAAGGLGTLQSSKEDSREVTAEYRDLESRLRNKQKEEDRLLEHLKTEAGNLQQILVIEKELSRVRSEAEQLAGQLQLLRDLSSLSTVVLNVREVEEYVPEAPPTFAARIDSTWSESFGALKSLGQVAVLIAVALAPWAMVAGVPLLLAIALYRHQHRTRSAA